MAYTCSLSPSNVKIFAIWFGILYRLPAARAKSRERHRRRSRLAAAAKLLVDRSCFAAPFGELFLSPAGIAPAVPADTAPDRASLYAARQGWQTEAPTPADAADCPEPASYQNGRLSAYPAWSATIDHCRGHTARRCMEFAATAAVPARRSSLYPICLYRCPGIDAYHGFFKSCAYLPQQALFLFAEQQIAGRTCMRKSTEAPSESAGWCLDSAQLLRRFSDSLASTGTSGDPRRTAGRHRLRFPLCSDPARKFLSAAGSSP